MICTTEGNKRKINPRRPEDRCGQTRAPPTTHLLELADGSALENWK